MLVAAAAVTVVTAAPASATRHPKHPPLISAVTPATGPATGGTSVVLSGFRFGSVSAVHFGSAPAAFTFVKVSTIDVVSPAGTAGVVPSR